MEHEQFEPDAGQQLILDNPLERAKVARQAALDALAISIRVTPGHRQAATHIPMLESLMAPLDVSIGNAGEPPFPDGEVPVRADNLLQLVTASAIGAMHEALHAVYGESRFSHDDAEVRVVSKLIKLLRVAYAHDPHKPIWLLDRGERNNTYELPSISLTVDLRGKNRQLGVMNDIGRWLGAAKLLWLAEQIVRRGLAASSR
jgi:hypothetical protein